MPVNTVREAKRAHGQKYTKGETHDADPHSKVQVRVQYGPPKQVTLSRAEKHTCRLSFGQVAIPIDLA